MLFGELIKYRKIKFSIFICLQSADKKFVMKRKYVQKRVKG